MVDRVGRGGTIKLGQIGIVRIKRREPGRLRLGELDLRGSLGVDASVPCGFAGLATTVTVRGPETAEAYGRVFEAVLATSANLANLTQPVRVAADLVVA